MYGKHSYHLGMEEVTNIEIDGNDRAEHSVSATLRAAALLVIEAHRVDRLTSLDELAENLFAIGNNVAMRNPK